MGAAPAGERVHQIVQRVAPMAEAGIQVGADGAQVKRGAHAFCPT